MKIPLIQSKSFKLYLNSFNQTRVADWETVQKTLQQDLSACANGDIEIVLHHLHEFNQQPIAEFAGKCIDNQDIEKAHKGIVLFFSR
ncbi:hypothetical protein AB204_19870 [Xenorhabdus khoisanae]|uniref:NADPH-dependent 7-cyano-7-deazaguanine reductase N-terminal domain-containing protein n=1 Tax=Xenorhabdus khoisanae TaxID=880157 RepID=A0A0J5FME4_9GAMM|nr:hypothetical protein AB204_19870 [Xenorhabdus khoisanae]